MLTVREAADRLRISVSLVYQLVESRRLAHYRVGTGRGCIRIAEESIDEYLAQCLQGTVIKKPAIPKKRLKHIRR